MRSAGFISRYGTLGEVATMRAMARVPGGGDTTLVELKAVDGAYPLYGAVVTEPAGRSRCRNAGATRRCIRRDGRSDPDVAIESCSQARLTVVGGATFEIRAILKTEPDKLAGGISFGPRLLISQNALRANAASCSRASLVRVDVPRALPPGANYDQTLG